MSIKTELELDPSKAVSQAGKAAAEIGGKLSKAYDGVNENRPHAGGLFSGAESGITKVQSGINVLKAGYEGLKKIIETGDAFGDMEDGLASVLPATADLNQEVEKLIELAKSPGLEFESVMKAHKNFLQMGKSSEESRDMIREIGNALQLSGADPKQLGSIVDVLTKMDDVGKPNIKMLHSLAQEATGLRQALKAGFGTENIRELEAMNLDGPRFLSGFTAGLHSLKTAQKDSADKLGDLQDDGKRLTAKLDQKAMEAVEGWGKGIEWAKLKFKEMQGEKVDWKQLYETPDARHKDTAADAAAKAANEAAINQMHAERLAKLEDETRKGEDLTSAKMKEMKIMREMALDAPSKAKERERELKDQQDYVDGLQLQLELQKNLKQLMADNLLTEKEATDLLRDKIAAQRRASNEQREMDQGLKKITDGKQLAAREKDNEIMEARSKGHNGKADRLQSSKDVADAKKQLMGLGMSDAEAEAQAKAEVRRKEDLAYRGEHGGRGRIHSEGGRPSEAGGIGSDTYKGTGWVKDHNNVNKDRDLRGDFQFASLEKMEAQKKAQVEASRNNSAPAEKVGAESAAAKLGASMESLVSVITGAVKLVEGAAKKYGASPLNK